MNVKMKCCNDISNKTESSNFLSVIPMREFSYVLNKKQFLDSIRFIIMIGLFQVYQLFARVELASMFSMPCHARREDLLPCDTTK